MRFFNILMIFLGVVAVLLLALLGLASAFYPVVLLSLGDFLAGPLVYLLEGLTARGIALSGSILLLVGLVYFVVGSVQAGKRARTVILQSPAGEVLVSLPAIEDFARVLKGKIEGLRDIKGRVIYTRKGLRVTARIVIFSDFSISEVSERVQEEIKEYIQKTLSISQEIKPTIIVAKVVAREKTGPQAGSRPGGASGKGMNGIPFKRS